MKRQSKFLSPAKLNLFFQVLKKRGDGFHDIASLYVKVSLFDELTFQFSDVDEFACDIPSLSSPDNLVIKARDLFRKKTGISEPMKIHLTKKIPIEAGLGGGSSNAASTLLALNELFEFPLSKGELFALSASLGSDVSFFLTQKPAFCTGRGEIVQEVDIHISYPLWIAKPDHISLATPKVYQNCIPGEVSTLDPHTILSNFEKNPLFINDLEPAAMRIAPALIQVKRDLLALGFDHVCMTGSGSAFFCVGLGEGKKPSIPGITFFSVQVVSLCL